MLQRPHFLPKVSPSSVAQTAHCVRIILYMDKSLGGSPTTKALEPLAGMLFLVSYRPASIARRRIPTQTQPLAGTALARIGVQATAGSQTNPNRNNIKLGRRAKTNPALGRTPAGTSQRRTSITRVVEVHPANQTANGAWSPACRGRATTP